MGDPAVLVVGAGSVGLVLGYHLALAGADVRYLVRPGRKSVFQAPQKLYSYDDCELKTFDGYHTLEETSDLVGQPFRFVVVTLDGYTSRTAQGAMTLRKLGDALRASGATFIMSGGFGIGLRETYAELLAIPNERLLSGFSTILSHPTRAKLPAHAPTDAALLARASVGYKQPSDGIGFRLGTHNASEARQFAALYNRCGVSRCALMSGALLEAVSNAGFPVFAASQLAGWPSDIKRVVADAELWQLACRAQREIVSLPRFGWTGKLLAPMFGARITALLHGRLQRDALPLDYQAFNSFHHGGKVHAQDIAALRDCLADGQRHGRPMTALNALLTRLELQEKPVASDTALNSDVRPG